MNDDRLTALDAGFLQTEDSDSHASLAVAALAIMEGPAPGFAELQTALDERSAGIPRCRQVLHTHVLDLSAPQWVEAHTFDIAHHVRRVTVSAPGDDAAVYRAVADVMERRLDRSRPLWESWVFEGLADGRWAILIKLHHCIADGVAATAMLAGVCDDKPTASHDEQPSATSQSSPLSLRGFDPIALGTDALRMMTSTARIGVHAARGAAQIVAGLFTTSGQQLNGQLSDLRQFGAAQVALADVQLVSERFGVTVNDVALAAITDGFRSAMLQRGIEPAAGPIRTLVPVSVRPAELLHVPDNRVSLLLPDLPVDRSDPLEQLRLVHKRLATAKGSGQRQAGSLVVAAANLVPFPIMASAVRLLGRLPQRGVVAVTTNVPGPRHQMRILGRPIVDLVPVPPIAVGMRTGIAVMSYADRLTFGVIGDYDAALDVDDLARGIEHGIAHLVSVASAAAHTHRLGNLMLLVS
ncbi:wax ester/triacylglycerol synthase family O-acyltransferase [Mycobacterium sp. CBMA293]|uniref:wax ester/triacylglycerol synthase family O-acyltransferase n=1 Tax=unclassified Mycolicibacterium TaxID=2636767 RepID=UPI0012DD16B8|nr:MULTISPECIES: wax ester/triacylglycerol synthase family O-acyltransferase [unclassified Mycolicibacterium]MUL47134.1 wax ester/triacylglycerol synthase family O-acyltransferase [Mycolicibacterium sp. CBMA 360]MUL58512.1 wax ester/triacylglycerol synthase family O-acyltransferase [Mycolicibacterium sp. CBMA 335]MUL73970.1 wax ester/triacylglycerol synthase family O-acyltransferase [Mycolicibacterium sp. CBMA 311]MUL93395.1 wax ester/triacylglycerol synthase family O-acyltransferase [Mycolicib